MTHESRGRARCFLGYRYRIVSIAHLRHVHVRLEGAEFCEIPRVSPAARTAPDRPIG